MKIGSCIACVYVVACFALLAACVKPPQPSPEPLVLTFPDGSCSGTAIAPHVILTATHCVDKEKSVAADGGALTVTRRIDDGDDHTLLVVTQTFQAGAQIAPIPSPGTNVHILGNPGELRGLYASGTVAGDGPHGEILLNLPIFFGDSGAAVLDDAGRIVGTITGVRMMSAPGSMVQWGIVLPFRFTAAQWREAAL